jgi:hypothetical protein
LAYGLAFGATLLKEFIPEVFREGSSNGATAGSEAARKFTTREKRSEESGDVQEIVLEHLPPKMGESPA